MRIRLAGEGEAGARGGPKGDLYIFVSVGHHDLFERDGPNLYCRAPVSMVTAALGGEIDAPTIDGGKVKIRIPEGAQTGERMRLRNKGMVKLNGGGARGDMYVELFVETPRKMTDRQKESCASSARFPARAAIPKAMASSTRSSASGMILAAMMNTGRARTPDTAVHGRTYAFFT